eukprot:IDg8395t1
MMTYCAGHLFDSKPDDNSSWATAVTELVALFAVELCPQCHDGGILEIWKIDEVPVSYCVLASIKAQCQTNEMMPHDTGEPLVMLSTPGAFQWNPPLLAEKSSSIPVEEQSEDVIDSSPALVD